MGRYRKQEETKRGRKDGLACRKEKIASQPFHLSSSCLMKKSISKEGRKPVAEKESHNLSEAEGRRGVKHGKYKEKWQVLKILLGRQRSGSMSK